jgi:hypothetical protein
MQISGKVTSTLKVEPLCSELHRPHRRRSSIAAQRARAVWGCVQCA